MGVADAQRFYAFSWSGPAKGAEVLDDCAAHRKRWRIEGRGRGKNERAVDRREVVSRSWSSLGM